MAELHSLLDYEPKIIIAWGESLKGKRKFTDFLMTNGFPELAALSNAINSDLEALKWLMANGYPEFAILSDAIDDEDPAIEWLKRPLRLPIHLRRRLPQGRCRHQMVRR